jgi:TatD DNase family protein
MIPYTDTHCHLYFDLFDEDYEQVLKRAWKAGLVWILNPGIDLPTNQISIDLAKETPGKISAAVGIHPNFGQPWTDEIMGGLREQVQQPGVVAVGEIGLDYYRQHTPHNQQRTMFAAQLELAAEFSLPVVIHNRDATDDLMRILSDWHVKLVQSGSLLADRPGVLHGFSADLETARRALEMNFYLGIGGPVTFRNAPERKAVTRDLPLDRILLETDAPFLAPHPHRGQRNEPAYIPLIAEEIARLHNLTPKEVAEATFENAQRLFKPDSKR